MELDSEPQVEGELVKDHVLVSNKEMQHSLELKGYGEESKKKFLLKPFESLYLLYSDKLKLRKGKKIIDFERIILGGFSQGGGIAIQLALTGDLPVRGFVVVAPAVLTRR